MTDLLILVLLPGGGDELQGIKRGIVERADIILVNKADGELQSVAQRTADEYRSAACLRGHGRDVPVGTCSALHDEGLDRAWELVQQCHAALTKSGELARRRTAHRQSWLWERTQQGLLERFRHDAALGQLMHDAERSVVAGDRLVPVAAAHVLTALFGATPGQNTNALLGRLNHVALAVPDMDAASTFYRTVLGAKVSAPLPLPEHGVTTVFVELPNTKIELLAPLGDSSPIAKFLEKNTAGGIHHICYETANLELARKRLLDAGVKLLNDGVPRIGAHGVPVIFLHPKDTFGALVELEQAAQ